MKRWCVLLMLFVFLSCAPKTIHGDVVVVTYGERFEYSDCLIIERDDCLEIRVAENTVVKINKADVRWFKVVGE